METPPDPISPFESSADPAPNDGLLGKEVDVGSPKAEPAESEEKISLWKVLNPGICVAACAKGVLREATEAQIALMLPLVPAPSRAAAHSFVT